MKTSSLPNLNRETISFPTFFSLIQDPDHHDDTTLNKRPKIDNSQYTEASDTSPLKVASAHVNNNNNNNDHRALDAASALMDDAESGCGSNSYGGDVEDCSFGSPSRSGYSVSNDGNTSNSRIGFGSPSRSGYSVSNDGNTSTSRIGSGSWVHQSFGPNRVPHSFPSLATATEGRDSLVSEEIREVEGESRIPMENEGSVLMEELNRTRSENKKLTEMLFILCENFKNSLRDSQSVDLISEEDDSSSKQRAC